MDIISVGILCATIAVGSYAICKKLSTIIIGLSVILDEMGNDGER